MRGFLISGLLCFTAAFATAAGAPKNINTSKTRGTEAETAIAINHANPQQVVAVSNLNSGAGLFHGWSTDGGKTWNHNVIANGDNLGRACCDAQLAADDFGNIFMAYLDANIDVKIGISTDGGATFKPLTFLTNLPRGIPRTAIKSLALAGQVIGGDQPSIAASASSVWMSWTNTSTGKIQTSGAAVTGLGSVGPFSAAQSLPAPHNTGDYGDTAIGPNGEVFVVYQDQTSGQGPATVYGSLDPDGLGPQGFGPPKAIQTTNVGGFDFIPAQFNRSIDVEAGLAWDRTGGVHNGRLYFIYVSEQPQESNDTDVNLRFSDDNGVTWSQSVRVNDDAGTTSQFNPRISLDPTTGNIGLAWYDARNDKGDHSLGDTNGIPNDDTLIYATVSKDGGSTFLPNHRISAGASNYAPANSIVDYGDYSGFAFYGGNFYFAAADNSNSTGDNPDGKLSTFDVYVAPVKVR
jgi:hypothetical protein